MVDFAEIRFLALKVLSGIVAIALIFASKPYPIHSLGIL